MLKFVETCCIGSYARAILLNPFSESFPTMVVALHCVCNRFDAIPYVNDQWELMRAFEKVHLTPLGIVIIGNDSDGDARRFLLQIKGMVVDSKLNPLPDNAGVAQREAKALEWARSEAEVHANQSAAHVPEGKWRRLTVEHQNFTLACFVREQDGVIVEVKGLNSQDTIHNCKKVVSKMLGSAFLMIGDFHISQAAFAAIDLKSVSDVTQTDFEGKDRQNFARTARMSSQATIAELETKKAEYSLHGHIAVLKVLAQYMQALLGKKMTMISRVKALSYTVRMSAMCKVQCACVRMWSVVCVVRCALCVVRCALCLCLCVLCKPMQCAYTPAHPVPTGKLFSPLGFAHLCYQRKDQRQSANKSNDKTLSHELPCCSATHGGA